MTALDVSAEAGMPDFALMTRIRPSAWQLIASDWPPDARPDARLNPQPLPPVERYQVAAATMAHEIARLAIEAHITGADARTMLTEAIDDWCGTPPWPRKWPHPWPHPRLGPVPDPWLGRTGQLVGALVFAKVAASLGDMDLVGLLSSAATRLTDAARQALECGASS